MRFINDSLHGALDYIVAVVLIVTPFLAGFAEHSQAALGLSVAAGVALFVYSLLTDYWSSVRQLIPYKVHLEIDFAVGIAFLIATFLLGFSGLVQTYYLVMGAGVILVVLFTDPCVELNVAPSKTRA